MSKNRVFQPFDHLALLDGFFDFRFNTPISCLKQDQGSVSGFDNARNRFTPSQVLFLDHLDLLYDFGKRCVKQ
jgi:hypothetical protein